MNLVIDIGNTRTKLFVFDADKLKTDAAFEKLTVSRLKKFLSQYNIEAAILSSVVAGNASLTAFLKSNTRFTELSHTTRLPVKNKYGTKQSLGNDRIANVCGAVKLFPRMHCLVIDAGTCVKYDFISSRNEYLGGAISPGLLMRYSSLHDYTAKLPVVKPSRTVKLLGTTTKESITSGVQAGMLNEMEGFISKYTLKYGRLKVILTGGDAGCFAHLFNFPIFAAPKLTAIGLNEILQYNYAKK
jgi:type III pantothenate kinase